MRRIRVSISGLLAGIAMLGLVLAALTHPSRLWGDSFYSLTLGTLLIAVLGVVYSRAQQRAFWVGFSVCGWAYFLAIWGPEPISTIGENLVTTDILSILYPLTLPSTDKFVPPTPLPPSPPGHPPRTGMTLPGGGSIVLVGGFGGGQPAAPPQSVWDLYSAPERITNVFGQPESPTFDRIGQSIFCLLFALLGGILTRRFQQERDRAQAGTAPAAPG
jgi:hypothetical protein